MWNHVVVLQLYTAVKEVKNGGTVQKTGWTRASMLGLTWSLMKVKSCSVGAAKPSVRPHLFWHYRQKGVISVCKHAPSLWSKVLQFCFHSRLLYHFMHNLTKVRPSYTLVDVCEYVNTAYAWIYVIYTLACSFLWILFYFFYFIPAKQSTIFMYIKRCKWKLYEIIKNGEWKMKSWICAYISTHIPAHTNAKFVPMPIPTQQQIQKFLYPHISCTNKCKRKENVYCTYFLLTFIIGRQFIQNNQVLFNTSKELITSITYILPPKLGKSAGDGYETVDMYKCIEVP